MNKSLLTLTLLGGALCAGAQHLTPGQALDRVIPQSRGASGFELVETLGSLYVFTDGESNLVLPSDARLRPIVGRFDASPSGEMPPALQWLLNGFNEQISEAVLTGSGSIAENYAGWQPVAPIMTVKWNQGNPYNLLCPSGTSTGCVATAMAQVMYTNRYAKGSGSFSYSFNGQTLSFDYDKAKFDFSVMTDTYDSKSSEASKQAVAELMYAAGVSVRMSYGPESGASPAEVAPALIKYFGYDATYTKELWRPYFNTADWERIIYTELQAGRPVVYCGTTPAGLSHAFVIDGYSDNGLFHVNWGWSGASDGYFALSALNPYNTTVAGITGGFDNMQYAILAVKPGAENPQKVNDPDPTQKIDLSGCEVVDFSAPDGYFIGYPSRLNFTIINKGKVDYNDIVHVGIYNANGDEVSYVERMTTLVAAGDAMEVNVSIQVEGEKELVMTPGTYTLKVQDHWRRSIFETPIEAKSGEPASGWQPGALSFFVANASASEGVAVISGSAWPHAPEINCYTPQKADLDLYFYEPGTENLLGKVAGVSRSFNYMFNQTFNWPGGGPKVSLPWGEYEVCYVNNGVQCSGRMPVRVGTSVNGLNYVPLSGDDSAVGVYPGNYSGEVAVPEKVTIATKTYTVKALEDCAFALSKVTGLDLPASVNSVGKYALRYAHSLNHVVFHSPEAPAETEVTFTYGMRYDAAVYAPLSAIESYEKCFSQRPVYSLFDKISAPDRNVSLSVGIDSDVELGVTPAAATINPDCRVSISPEGVAEFAGAGVSADGNLRISLKGLAEGSATVKVVPAQPGVEPVEFTVDVKNSSAIGELSTAAGENDATIYDLQGRKVLTPGRGLYIINGRKTLVR